jgi:hypothetical protein
METLAQSSDHMFILDNHRIPSLWTYLRLLVPKNEECRKAYGSNAPVALTLFIEKKLEVD